MAPSAGASPAARPALGAEAVAAAADAGHGQGHGHGHGPLARCECQRQWRAGPERGCVSRGSRLACCPARCRASSWSLRASHWQAGLDAGHGHWQRGRGPRIELDLEGGRLAGVGARRAGLGWAPGRQARAH
eukprot:1639264-Rhodomonas_salina.1